MRIALQLLALALIAAPAWSASMADQPKSVDEIPVIAAAKAKATPAVYEYVHEIDMWLLTVKPVPAAGAGDDLRPSERLHAQLTAAYNKEVVGAHMESEARERAMIEGKESPGALAGAAEYNMIQVMRTYYQIDGQRLRGDVPKKAVAVAAAKPAEPADPAAPPAPKIEVTVHHKGDPVDP